MGQSVRNATSGRSLPGFIVLILSLGIGASASGRQVREKGAGGPFRGTRARSAVSHAAAPPSHLVYAWILQDAPETGGAHVSVPAESRKISLPDGPGKKLATQYCQDCHTLANLTSAHKQLEQWHKTVQTMIDRGARLPPDKIDVLVDYLAKNFPAAQAATSLLSGSRASSTASGTASGAEKAGLPDGPGKTIATQYCQSCHRIMLVTRARKSAPEWRQSIQKMVYFGSTLPKQDVEPLTRYLAKNFGPEK